MNDDNILKFIMFEIQRIKHVCGIDIPKLNGLISDRNLTKIESCTEYSFEDLSKTPHFVEISYAFDRLISANPELVQTFK